MSFRFALFLVSTLIAISAFADSAFHHHDWQPGEQINYYYEDTDTTFTASQQDGVAQPGDAVQIQEIHIPVSVSLYMNGTEGRHRMLSKPHLLCCPT